jgi:hypothetical protein
MNRSAKIIIVAALLTLFGQGVANAFELCEMAPLTGSVPNDCHESSARVDPVSPADQDCEHSCDSLCNGAFTGVLGSSEPVGHLTDDWRRFSPVIADAGLRDSHYRPPILR